MDLSTVTMPKHEARARFLEYRRSVRERHDDEDEQIMRGYKALAAGHQLLSLRDAIAKGGTTLLECHSTWTTRTLVYDVPRLAVMRADEQWCHLRRGGDGSVVFHRNGFGPRTNERRATTRLPADTLPRVAGELAPTNYSLRAMVPTVPPALRPAHSLGNYHILFEAEWTPTPPRDPALIRHIGGDLYAVVAVWDLTEVERLVLAGRFGD